MLQLAVEYIRRFLSAVLHLMTKEEEKPFSQRIHSFLRLLAGNLNGARYAYSREIITAK